MLPQPEPWTACELFIMPSVGGGDVAWAERPYVRSFEHSLYLRNLVDDAFNVHASQYLTEGHPFRHSRSLSLSVGLACFALTM